jgi:deoxycytidylate deaminase
MKFSKLKEISIALAPKHPCDKRCRHFTFILSKKKILTIGFNNQKTHPFNLKYNFVNRKNDPINDLVGTHSELNALIKLGTDEVSGLTLVNTRVNRNGEIDLSMPCSGCQSFLKTLDFKKIFYSTKDGKFEQYL